MAETPGDATLGAAGAHLMEFSEKMQQRAAQEKRGPAQVLQLPLWPEATRGAPNAVLRGALFAAVHKDRRYMDRELLAAQDGITVRFTGKQLDQADLDVWEQALHLARTQALRDLQAAGAIRDFEIRNDLVHVQTVPSKSQRKHLAARRPPNRRRK